jgi:hypothetical protein
MNVSRHAFNYESNAPKMQIVRGKYDIAVEGFLLLQIMQPHQTSYRLPIHVLVQEKAQIWCKLGAK